MTLELCGIFDQPEDNVFSSAATVDKIKIEPYNCKSPVYCTSICLKGPLSLKRRWSQFLDQGTVCPLANAIPAFIAESL